MLIFALTHMYMYTSYHACTHSHMLDTFTVCAFTHTIHACQIALKGRFINSVAIYTAAMLCYAYTYKSTHTPDPCHTVHVICCYTHTSVRSSHIQREGGRERERGGRGREMDMNEVLNHNTSPTINIL